MTPCSLCQPTLGPIIAEGEHWRVVLNRNQNLLGKLMLVLRRHEERVSELRPDEWAELHLDMRRTERALTTLLQPDHFNFLFLRNQDRHVHLHVVPRYAAVRLFQSLAFEDPDYPAHYAVPSPVRYLADERQEALAAALREAYERRA
ncbi:HIT family protein [Deinococcus planocerae]|uniref:HIT family protein n=1 Tax=Deinococcus planocerae TaxID=1737569 RepID=UPI000C7E8FE1|nr:HIT family protein [Deinococcus planocerae]